MHADAPEKTITHKNAPRLLIKLIMTGAALILLSISLFLISMASGLPEQIPGTPGFPDQTGQVLPPQRPVNPVAFMVPLIAVYLIPAAGLIMRAWKPKRATAGTALHILSFLCLPVAGLFLSWAAALPWQHGMIVAFTMTCMALLGWPRKPDLKTNHETGE